MAARVLFQCVRTKVSARNPRASALQHRNTIGSPRHSDPDPSHRTAKRSLGRRSSGACFQNGLKEPRRGCCAPNRTGVPWQLRERVPTGLVGKIPLSGSGATRDPGGCNPCTCPRTQAFCHDFVLVLKGGIPELWCSAAHRLPLKHKSLKTIVLNVSNLLRRVTYSATLALAHNGRYTHPQWREIAQ